MDESRNRAVLMRATSFVLAVTLAVGAAAPALGAQSTDLGRTIDAEVRVATFEMASGNQLPALSRLERLAARLAQDSSRAAAPERAGLHFLLAQSYYRLGMLTAFRREAEASLAADPTRYAALLRPQLVVEAYRAGDYPRATTLSRDMPATEASGLGALVAGLAAYQSGDLAAARSAFQRVATSNGQFAAYAKYMDAIAHLRGDTAQAGNAVASLEAVAAAATGAFADQVRLTAAQVAYEGEHYADAVRIASTITDGSQVAAPALLTRAWALYKLDRVDDAQRAFSDFATRYANRPERDEAQLMAAQAQLELGRSADAEVIFQRVANSSSADVTTLQAETNAAIADIARALVADRAADLLVVGDPSGAKALILRDTSDAQAALAYITGSTSAPSTVTSQPSIVAASPGTRLDSLSARATPGVRRVLFAPASATRQSGELTARSQSLAAADAAVAVARYRLTEQLEAQQRQIALLTRLAALLAADSAAVGGLVGAYQVLADSVARLDQLMAAAEARLRDLLGREIQETRRLAAENARIADSLRKTLSVGAGPDDVQAIDAEVATAAAYTRIADMAAGGLDKAIAHHPAFVLRDSLHAHSAHAKTLLAEIQAGYTGSRRDIDAALVALRAGDDADTRAARQAVSDAEGRRTSVEGEAIAAVTAELLARAAEMVAGLQRNAEAAQFGVASAAFFRAIDGTRAVGDAGAAGSSALPRTTAPDRRR